MEDDECKCDKDKDEEKHVCTCITLHGEVDVELRWENKKNNNKREYWARPDKNKNTEEDKEGVPHGEGNTFRDLYWLVNTFKKRHFGFFYPKGESLCVWVDKVERNS